MALQRSIITFTHCGRPGSRRFASTTREQAGANPATGACKVRYGTKDIVEFLVLCVLHPLPIALELVNASRQHFSDTCFQTHVIAAPAGSAFKCLQSKDL
jgi:hypothetical protein